MKLFLPLLACLLLLAGCEQRTPGMVELAPDDNVVLIGGNLCNRMTYFGHFETALYQAYPDARVSVRNMCDPGNTAGFRPHSSRVSPWAFPGADDYNGSNHGVTRPSDSQGYFPTEDEWLDTLNADVVLAFFGFSESFNGPEGLTNFALELDSFMRHTQAQLYNEESAPEIVLLSPIAFEDLSDKMDLPDGVAENKNLELYTQAMGDMAADNGVKFIDLFTPSREWMKEGQITTDGISLNEKGYRKLSTHLSQQLFNFTAEEEDEELHAAIEEKNYFWQKDFKMPNGVHVYGRRFEPYGVDNYPFEIKKVRQMTLNRDEALWAYLADEDYDLAGADKQTETIPEIETNYTLEPVDSIGYLYGEDALASFTMAPGYKVELFASEQDFPDLANPAQMNWDNKGRLWLSCMPSYPHYKPGDPKPDDKIVILEDTDKDGKADKLIVWADSIHLPVGFEFADDGGIYLSQGTDLVYMADTDGDDKADYSEILMSGFDDHDTHHNISAFEADPGGGIIMGEGIFLHTNVETPYGPVRATNGGWYRFDGKRRKLERHAQIAIPNPWGIVHDDNGQPIFLHTSDPNVRWMLPSTMRNTYAANNPMAPTIIEEDHRVRPTSGIEIVSSRHFPPETQGDLMLNNTIGYLGIKQHRMFDAGMGFDTRWRQDLIRSNDGNYRPVDMEFAPDGSLYIVDWHNVLVGHMQHNARDPLRDHVHGRVYRVTYPDRPLVEEAPVAGASLDQLLANLELPEYRTRYRTRRELRGRDTDEVLAATRTWVAGLDNSDPNYEKYLREAAFVTWGANKLDRELLDPALNARDFRVRAAAARVVRYLGHQIEDRNEVMLALANDPHPRVRMEAMVAATWLPEEDGMPIIAAARENARDEFTEEVGKYAEAHIRDEEYVEPEGDLLDPDSPLAGMYAWGKSLYHQEGYCVTCHQEDGKGLRAAGYPPLAGSRWVTGAPERLIKLTMHGIYGPIEVLGKQYDGQVPMTAYGGMVSNEEMAAILTFVRNSFGNSASAIKPGQVAMMRTSTAGREGYYTAEELLEEYPDPPSGK